MARNRIQHEGAEAVEETGYGRIVKLEHDGESRNAHVTFDAEHLSDPVSAWADTSWLPTWGKINELYAVDARCWYRIVVHRRGKVDKSMPFDSLAKSDKVRDLLECREAPRRANGQAPTPSHAPAEAPRTADSAPTGPDPTEPPPPPPEGETGAPGASGGRRPRMQEAKPWEASNSDGSPNLGSYAFTAAVSMVQLAQELWLAGHPGHPGAVDDVARAEVAKLARCLLMVSDTVQAHARRDGRSDRMDNSHTRARGALRCAVEALPVPWDADRNERAVWVAAVERHADWVMSTAEELMGA